jgi:hypothetical protein
VDVGLDKKEAGVNNMDKLKIRIETDEYVYEEWIIDG